MDAEVKLRRKKKDRKRDGIKSRAQSFGADLDELEAERNIVFDIEDNRKRRTIQLVRERGSCGFTIQTYGIKNKKTGEVEVFTFVDYVEVTGPAHRAGLRKGDIILSVNGKSVEFATHKELVEVIRSSGEKLRMVVLFVDCCTKVELYDRLIKLKRILLTKVEEVRELERQEREMLDDFCHSRGLDRFHDYRQSVISTCSSLSSWDAYSLLNSPASLLNLPNTATSHFNRDTSFTSSSKSSEGDISCDEDFDSCYQDVSFVDESESDDFDDDISVGKIARRGTLKGEESNLSLTNYFSNEEDRERRDTLVLGADDCGLVDETDHDMDTSSGHLHEMSNEAIGFRDDIHESEDKEDSRFTAQGACARTANGTRNVGIKIPRIIVNGDENESKTHLCVEVHRNDSVDASSSSVIKEDFSYSIPDAANVNDYDIPFCYEGNIYINEKSEDSKL